MTTITDNDLKAILTKIDSRLERIESDLTTIKVSQARVEEKLNSLDDRVGKLEDSQNRQIWTLIIAITGAMAAGIIKFGFFPNP
ncbi:hemolysin XhlA family protein [Synechocystis sp. B12]|jgi:predicted nuclease with TOPRIM domain|nr:hemolysin XhlA family protein [Synechocystis sp. B12]